MISIRIFIVFKTPPKQLIYLDKRFSKSDREPKYVVPSPKRSGLFPIYKWCFVERHCTYCNLIGHNLEKCLYVDVVITDKVHSIKHVNQELGTSTPYHRSRVRHNYQGRSENLLPSSIQLMSKLQPISPHSHPPTKPSTFSTIPYPTSPLHSTNSHLSFDTPPVVMLTASNYDPA
eukprot:TRINITY_DN7861_c0_g1_i15.p1 TRINITY_DN7861_c0_g1~~TRINITY_DN7861_c0_g1_i15.p1  ORF type:complete len:175 (+),score=6.81 TRINITY_DN7861_c0_g1_i15:242-766(+)